MEMEVVEASDTCVKVALRGRLDVKGVGAIDLPFTVAVAPKRINTIVDFSGVTFISSLGFRMLVTVAKTLARHGAKMVVYGLQEIVAEAFRTTSIDEIIPVAADESQARALIAG